MKFITSIITLVLLSGCAAVQVPYKEIPKLEFEKSPRYEINLDSIQKPSAPKVKYGDYTINDTIKIITPEEVSSKSVVIFDLEEYKKIGQLTVLALSYKSIIQQQEVLINQKIDIENSLKEFVELERLKSKEYADMWIDNVNMLNQERHSHTQDNVINKIFEAVLASAVLVLAF
jgi:hypothetical protein